MEAKTNTKTKIVIKGRVASKKNSRRLFYSHGKQRNLPSVAYDDFKFDALSQLKTVRECYMGKALCVEYFFEMKGRLDADVDNMVAAVNDVLQDGGVIDDDKNIRRIVAEKSPGHADFTTTIQISIL